MWYKDSTGHPRGHPALRTCLLTRPLRCSFLFIGLRISSFLCLCSPWGVILGKVLNSSKTETKKKPSLVVFAENCEFSPALLWSTQLGLHFNKGDKEALFYRLYGEMVPSLLFSTWRGISKNQGGESLGALPKLYSMEHSCPERDRKRFEGQIKFAKWSINSPMWRSQLVSEMFKLVKILPEEELFSFF